VVLSKAESGWRVPATVQRICAVAGFLFYGAANLRRVAWRAIISNLS
jgi:hypothetical protein